MNGRDEMRGGLDKDILLRRLRLVIPVASFLVRFENGDHVMCARLSCVARLVSDIWSTLPLS
jgi:hypothetical protein